MLIIAVMQLLFPFAVGLSSQLRGMQEEPVKYYMMEIRSATAGDLFEFDLVRLSRTGKEVVFEQVNCRAPFSLKLYDETFLILHAKSGRAKIVKQYRMFEGEQRSYQYFERGEAIIIEFLPKPVGGGPTRSWSEGMRIAPRLTVTLMNKAD